MSIHVVRRKYSRRRKCSLPPIDEDRVYRMDDGTASLATDIARARPTSASPEATVNHR